MAQPASEWDVNSCPLHKVPLSDRGSVRACFICDMSGVKAVQVAIDDVGNIIRTMEDKGYTLERHRSFVVLVFQEPNVAAGTFCEDANCTRQGRHPAHERIPSKRAPGRTA